MRTKKSKNSENSLLSALKFISIAQSKSGPDIVKHCKLFNNWATASNSIISAGHPIAEDINGCPNTYSLIKALENMPDGHLSITLKDDGIAVKSENFEAIVNCILPENSAAIGMDAASFHADNTFAKSVEIASKVISEKENKLITSSMQLTSDSVLATNGHIIIEAWHGLNIAQIAGLVVPKAFGTALSKVKDKTVYRVGNSQSTLTVHYADGAWLRTQLYVSPEPLPVLETYLTNWRLTEPIPEGFWPMLHRLKPFASDGVIRLAEGAGYSGENSTEAKALEVCNRFGFANVKFDINSLLSIEKYVKSFHYDKANQCIYFYGDKVRAVLAVENA